MKFRQRFFGQFGGFLVVIFFNFNYAFSQINNEIPRTSDRITIDGIADDSGWANALKINLEYEVAPAENLTANQQTDAYLISNDESLYILFKAFDSNPERIRAYLSDRDDIDSSDHVSIALDTFNDSRKAFKFAVNAIGVQADSIIDEIAGAEDSGWDGIWRSAGKLTKSGYQVEIEIPFKSLRFEDKVALKHWKIKLQRVLPREVVYFFSNVKNHRDKECQLCEYQQVSGFADITPAKNITFIPAVTFSDSKARQNVDSEWLSEEIEHRESLDLRWGINQNLYLNATLNPDFSQVEADSLQLETNKRFAIKTTEKRAFFLDGADYFSNWSRLVHTRLFTEPEYGAKLTGKSGEHSYGFIILEDKDTNFLITDNQSSRLIRLEGINSENQIARYRYDAGENGNLGITYTNRSAGEYSNELVAVDGKYWFNQSTYVKFQSLITDTQDFETIRQTRYTPEHQSENSSANATSVNLTHANRDWSTSLTHHRFEDGVRVDSGFVSRSDWVSSSARFDYRWYPKLRSAWWNRIDADYTFSEVSDIEGTRLNQFRQGGVQVSAKYQSFFGVRFFDDIQNFVPQKLLSSINPAIYENKYAVKIYETYAGLSPVAGLDLEVFYEWGDDVDFVSAEIGALKTINFSANYQFNDNWRFTGEYINQSLELTNVVAFDVDLANLRASYQYDIRQSLRLTIQWQREGEDKALASQLLYSYKVNPFSLFYLGYSDNSIATAQNVQLQKTDKTLFLKFSYAWQL